MVSHLDPDRLVILALDEGTADAAESVHLVDCTGCQTEIDTLRHVAGLSAETQDLRDLPPPPDRVWQGIAAEVAESRPMATAPVVPLHTGVRPRTAPRRNTPRWLTPVLAAAAAAVLAVAGTVSVIRLVDRQTAPTITARAALAPLKDAPANAHGEVEVLGGAELQLDVDNLPLTTGFHEVWLLDPENPTKMVAVGNLNPATGSNVVLPLPTNIDLNQFRLVDVSAEAWDGNSQHSGKSLLRGTLTN